MPPKLNWRRLTPHSVWSEGSDYAVIVTRVKGKECGYPQCPWMHHMSFSKGGCMASAFLETAGSAQLNAERIVASLRGTHNDYGRAKSSTETRP